MNMHRYAPRCDSPLVRGRGLPLVRRPACQLRLACTKAAGLLCIAVTFACATAEGSLPPAGAKAQVDGPVPEPAAPAAAPAEPIPPAPAWSDPDFARRLAQGYLSETDVEPRPTSTERDNLQKGVELALQGQLAQASQWLEQHRSATGSAAIDYGLAHTYLQQDRLADAAKAYQTAVQKHPKFRRAWRMLGQVQHRLGDFKNAAHTLTSAIENGDNDATTYGLLGDAYTHLGNHISAESALRMAVLLKPASVDWQIRLASSLAQQQRFPEAAAMLQVLIAKQPERAELWRMQAHAYLGMNQPSKAAENLEIVDRLGASTVESLQSLGDIYLSESLFDLAVNAHVRALEKDPKAPEARAIRAAKVLTTKQALPEAKQLIERITATRRDVLTKEARKDLLKLQAHAAGDEGAEADEAQALEEVVKLDPLDGNALIRLGQNHGRRGQPERAIVCFEQAASIAGFEAEAKLRHAQLLVRQGNHAEAIPLLRRVQAIKARPDVQSLLEHAERAKR